MTLHHIYHIWRCTTYIIFDVAPHVSYLTLHHIYHVWCCTTYIIFLCWLCNCECVTDFTIEMGKIKRSSPQRISFNISLHFIIIYLYFPLLLVCPCGNIIDSPALCWISSHVFFFFLTSRYRLTVYSEAISSLVFLYLSRLPCDLYLITCLRSPTSVSYTHLDVYKRQVYKYLYQ